jgi:hypothetical protein
MSALYSTKMEPESANLNPPDATEYIYITQISMSVRICRSVLGAPLWSSGQRPWLQNGDILCFL